MASLAIRNPPVGVGSAAEEVSVITETSGDGLVGRSKPFGSDWKRFQRGLRDQGVPHWASCIQRSFCSLLEHKPSVWYNALSLFASGRCDLALLPPSV